MYIKTCKISSKGQSVYTNSDNRHTHICRPTGQHRFVCYASHGIISRHPNGDPHVILIVATSGNVVLRVLQPVSGVFS